MEEKTCSTCAYFVQHYRKGQRGYRIVAWGHCTIPPIMPQYSESPACAHYQEAVEPPKSGKK